MPGAFTSIVPLCSPLMEERQLWGRSPERGSILGES